MSLPVNVDRAFRRIVKTSSKSGYIRLMVDIRLVLDWLAAYPPECPGEQLSVRLGWHLRNELCLGTHASKWLGNQVIQREVRDRFSVLHTIATKRAEEIEPANVWDRETA